VADAEVGVQPTLDGQEIIVQHSEVGQRLACLLAPGPDDAQVVRRDGALYWHIPHSQEVDKLLMELADLFISIRCSHPILAQLELALSIPSMSERCKGEGTGLEPGSP
jgi:hypothetical protein